MKPVTPCSTTSGTEPQRQAITGVPQAIASIITRPNGSGQSIGNSSAVGIAEELGLLVVADLADELDQRIVEQRLDHLVEIGPVGGVDLGGDLQRHARARWRSRSRGRAASPARSGPGTRGSRLWLGREAVRRSRQAVMHGGDPVGVRQRPALVVARSKPAGTAATARRPRPDPSGPAGHAAWSPSARPCRAKNGKWIRSTWKWRTSNSCRRRCTSCSIDRCAARSDFSGAGIEPDRLIAHRHQLGLGLRVGAGEQGHLVAQVDQRVGQVGDDPLGAAIESRRHGFVQRRDLGDPHSSGPNWAPALPEADINISYPITQVEVTSLHQVDHSNQRMNIPHVPLVAGYSFAPSECWRSVNAVFTSR